MVFMVKGIKKHEDFREKGVISKLKRESLELSLKSAVEMGVSEVYIVQTDFSQNFKLNHERLMKIYYLCDDPI